MRRRGDGALVPPRGMPLECPCLLGASRAMFSCGAQGGGRRHAGPRPHTRPAPCAHRSAPCAPAPSPALALCAVEGPTGISGSCLGAGCREGKLPPRLVASAARRGRSLPASFRCCSAPLLPLLRIRGKPCATGQNALACHLGRWLAVQPSEGERLRAVEGKWVERRCEPRCHARAGHRRVVTRRWSKACRHVCVASVAAFRRVLRQMGARLADGQGAGGDPLRGARRQGALRVHVVFSVL